MSAISPTGGTPRSSTGSEEGKYANFVSNLIHDSKPFLKPLLLRALVVSVGLDIISRILGLSLLVTVMLRGLWAVYELNDSRFGDARLRHALQMGLQENPDILRLFLKEFPVWIEFPEFEKALFLNKALAGLWPHINQYLSGLLQTQINTVLPTVTPKHAPGLSLAHMSLGEVPPVITGVRARHSAEQIVLDLTADFAGTPLVELLVGRHVSLRLEDLRLYSRVRLILSNLAPVLPFFRSLTVSFLGKPHLDFRFEAMHLNVMGVPGLPSVINDVLKDKVFDSFTWPRRIVVPTGQLSEQEVRELSELVPVALLKLRALRGRELPKMDRFGLADPYLTLRVGDTQFHTRIVKNSLNPTWDEEFQFEIFDEDLGKLRISVWDADFGVDHFNSKSNDDLIGHVEVDLQTVPAGEEVWYPILEAASGMVCLQMTVVSLCGNVGVDLDVKEQRDANTPRAEEFQGQSPGPIASSSGTADEHSLVHTSSAPATTSPHHSRLASPHRLSAHISSPAQTVSDHGYIMLELIRADDLPPLSSVVSMDVYARLQIGNGRMQSTAVPVKNRSVEWKEEFKFDADSLSSQSIEVVLMNKHVIRHDTVVGTLSVPLKSLPYGVSKTAEYDVNLSDDIVGSLREAIGVNHPKLTLKTWVIPFE